MRVINHVGSFAAGILNILNAGYLVLNLDTIDDDAMIYVYALLFFIATLTMNIATSDYDVVCTAVVVLVNFMTIMSSILILYGIKCLYQMNNIVVFITILMSVIACIPFIFEWDISRNLSIVIVIMLSTQTTVLLMSMIVYGTEGGCTSMEGIDLLITVYTYTLMLIGYLYAITMFNNKLTIVISFVMALCPRYIVSLHTVITKFIMST